MLLIDVQKVNVRVLSIVKLAPYSQLMRVKGCSSRDGGAWLTLLVISILLRLCTHHLLSHSNELLQLVVFHYSGRSDGRLSCLSLYFRSLGNLRSWRFVVSR